MNNKLDIVIEKMGDIIEKEKEPVEKEKGANIDEENLENLIRKIVFEAFDERKVKPVVSETDDRKNSNALDAILENLLSESYAEDNEVENGSTNQKSIKPKTEKEEMKDRRDSDTGPAVVSDGLVDEIVESIFPLVSRLGSDERDSEVEEIDEEVILHSITAAKLILTLQVILIDNVKEKQKEDEDEDVDDEEEEEEEEGDDDSLDVVHKALAAIIGENPSEEEKLSQEVIQLCVSLLFSLVFTN